MVSAINTNTFLSDLVLQVRNDLRSNITDPYSASRDSDNKWVMTSYPKRKVIYPQITVQHINQDGRQLGLQSSLMLLECSIEVRVWARNQKEKDVLSQECINRLRSIQYTSDGTVQAKLFDFSFDSAVNVDEDGEEGPKSRVMQFTYKYILGE